MLKYLENVVTLQLDVRACNGCGMCVSVCPHAVFEIKERKAVIVDRDACIECGACAINCPLNAVRVQTGAGCATGVLLGAIGIDSCCSGACGASPSIDDIDQEGCCTPEVKKIRIVLGTTRANPTDNLTKQTGIARRLIIYESTMCCSGGVCGPNTDKSLVNLQHALEELMEQGVEVERYSITENPKNFRENAEVVRLMKENQAKALPITTCDGKVVKTGAYPSLAELKEIVQESRGSEPSP